MQKILQMKYREVYESSIQAPKSNVGNAESKKKKGKWIIQTTWQQSTKLHDLPGMTNEENNFLQKISNNTIRWLLQWLIARNALQSGPERPSGSDVQFNCTRASSVKSPSHHELSEITPWKMLSPRLPNTLARPHTAQTVVHVWCCRCWPAHTRIDSTVCSDSFSRWAQAATWTKLY